MLLQSTEVKNSNAMELEGLKRCRKQLEDFGINVKSLTTDRHVTVQAWMRKEWPSIAHYYDT